MSREVSKSERRLLGENHEFAKVEASLRATIGKLIAAEPLADCRSDLNKPIGLWFSSIYVIWNSGWGTECTVDIKMNDESVFSMEDSDNGGESVKKDYILRSVTAMLTWSSTNRNVSQATAAMAIYRRAVEFAATIENMFSDTYWLQETE